MWFVAAAVVVGAWIGETPESGAVSAVPLVSGAELRLPQPSAWPCGRFVSVKLEALEGEEAEPYPGQEDGVSVEWKASGRHFRVAGRTFPGPLPAAALPRAMVLISGSPHDRIRLSLSCNDNPDVASEAYDNERFKGVSWLCTAAGCRAKAGYPLPHRLVRSSRRLRLCSTPRKRETGDSYCDRRHRDVRPAFVDAGAATALARDILEDARRATDDACRVAGGCNGWVRTSLAAVHPAGWGATSWRVWARDQPSRGDEGMELSLKAGAHTLRLECWARPTGGVQGCWLEARDREGGRLFDYYPIRDDNVPEARFDRRETGDDIVLAADPENEIPPTAAPCRATLSVLVDS